MKEFETKKKFGQNFLTDKNLLSAICLDAKLKKEDEVLEIGSGMGALTEFLSAYSKKVISFEIDKDLENILLAKKLPNVEFVFEDVMQKDLREIEKIFEKDYKLVANLPYYITSPILFKFLGSKKLKSITVMVQKEVAERMVAKEGSKDYGVLSVSVAVYGEATITRIVSRNMFTPAPNVDSAVVRIDIKNNYQIDKYDEFFEFVKAIFSMRRKTIANNLNHIYNVDKTKLETIYGEEVLKKRAEDFSIQEIVEMFKKLKFSFH